MTDHVSCTVATFHPAGSAGHRCGDAESIDGLRSVRITRDTLDGMDTVSIRDLRNRGGDIVDRARMGEQLTITSSGRPVATLGPLPRPPVSLAVLVERRASLPPVDPRALRADLDRLIDPEL